MTRSNDSDGNDFICTLFVGRPSILSEKLSIVIEREKEKGRFSSDYFEMRDLEVSFKQKPLLGFSLTLSQAQQLIDHLGELVSEELSRNLYIEKNKNEQV